VTDLTASGRSPVAAAVELPAGVGDYVALLKPRVMSLVVFTGLVGMVLAPGAMNPVLAIIALLAISLGAGAAGAINMWYDADIDAAMARTRLRPIPSGRVPPGEALGFGLFVAAVSVVIMGLMINLLAAALLALTIAFYVLVYTMWLKRRTAQNIVIGGAAGALPPVIGWAAASGSVDWLPFVLFAIVFLWTPPHFWALALYRRDDYARARVPMLPVTAGSAATRRQILIYTLILAPFALIPWFMGETSAFYGIGAAMLGAAFLVMAWQVFRRGAAEEADETHRSARRLFGGSIFYLFLVFSLLLVDFLGRTAGLLAA
jgi:protoheme IX farnesyltransferase